MAGIPKSVKELVWNKYIGEKQEGKCYCCRVRTITAFNFEAGHVISKKNGGQPVVENLRPVCKPCNGSMGVKNLEDFRAENFPTGNKKQIKSKGKKKSSSNEIDKFDKWLGF